MTTVGTTNNLTFGGGDNLWQEQTLSNEPLPRAQSSLEASLRRYEQDIRIRSLLHFLHTPFLQSLEFLLISRDCFCLRLFFWSSIITKETCMAHSHFPGMGYIGQKYIMEMYFF